jgi:hypothetical protein
LVYPDSGRARTFKPMLVGTPWMFLTSSCQNMRYK